MALQSFLPARLWHVSQLIRRVEPADSDAIFAILEPVLRAGETYSLPRDLTRQEALHYWLAPTHEVFVLQEDAGEILGTYFLRPNQFGGGAHVANCGYITADHATGRGVARAIAATHWNVLAPAASAPCNSIRCGYQHPRCEALGKLWFLRSGPLAGSFLASNAGLCRCLGDASETLGHRHPMERRIGCSFDDETLETNINALFSCHCIRTCKREIFEWRKNVLSTER